MGLARKGNRPEERLPVCGEYSFGLEWIRGTPQFSEHKALDFQVLRLFCAWQMIMCVTCCLISLRRNKGAEMKISALKFSHQNARSRVLMTIDNIGRLFPFHFPQTVLNSR